MDRVHERLTGWCVLRTGSRRTIKLAESLNGAGIEAWTPTAIHRRRLSRRHMGFREVDEPIVPSFVFVRARHLGELMGILARPISPHPSFTIFQHAGRAPVIADRQFWHIRKIEADAREAHQAEKERRSRAELRAIRRQMRADVAVGSTVRMGEGAFAGLTGVVEELVGKAARVRFSDTLVIEVASWIMLDAEVEAPPSKPTGSAAGVPAKADVGLNQALAA